VCRACCGFDLTEDEAFELIRTDYSHRCKPPWSEAEILHKVKDAYASEPRRGWLLDEDKPFHMTDSGNGLRLAHYRGENLRYVHTWGKWLVWDGARWKVDDTAAAHRHALETVREIYREAADAGDETTRKALGAWARSSESRGRLEAMLWAAARVEGIPVASEA